jgi:hypothetical protein
MRKLIFIAIAALTIVSCTKNEVTTSYENPADKFVAERVERTLMTEDEVDMFLGYCSLWPKEILMDMACKIPSTSPKQRYERLMSTVSLGRGVNEVFVESIIQQTSKKRIIDANPSLVAFTIANLGLPTNGQLIGIDYHRSAANVINNTDVFLAGWAYGTTYQNGSQFASFDSYIEFQDVEPVYTAEFSGGNYTIEGVIIYNGPPTLFSFYNVQTAQVEQRTIETGEVLVYGPDSEFGELFFNLTLIDEVIGSDTYNTATIQGPIPGTVSLAQPPIALSGGPWPIITQ